MYSLMAQIEAVRPRYELFPKKKFKDFKMPEQTIPNSKGHAYEWLSGFKTGKDALCNFGYAGPLAETVLLGNVSHRVGHKLEWDPKNLKVTNCSEAEQYIRREYRKGWEL
jgi:hypothetical protein